MKRRTKQIVFYLFVLLFIILACPVVLFAFGYKYDFVQNKLLKTGSFRIGTNVGAQIYVNDELAGATSFLGKSFSRGRLLPRTYAVRAQSNGYQPWQKLIDIEPGIFTDFPLVVLIPLVPAEETVASSSIGDISSIKFNAEKKTVEVSDKRQTETISLENGRKVSLEPRAKPIPTAEPEVPSVKSPEKSNEVKQFGGIKSPDGDKSVWIDNRELWVGWLKDVGYQPARKAGDAELITRFSQKISDVQWYKDSAHLIADVGGVLKFIEIDTRGGLNIFDVSAVERPFYYNRETDAIFKFEGNKLVKVSLK